MKLEEISIRTTQLKRNISRVIVGKEEVLQLAVVALLCEGHVLLEDVPGIGKTMLAKSIARSLGGSFQRIQCTPDLLPSDVTGLSIYNQKTQTFEFHPGPIVAQIVLADEINRATPRTQAALLEAMEERQITVEGKALPLPRPFFVLATQNPVELEGTFPLPEAQLDRFFMRLRLGYPAAEEERTLLRRFRESNPLEELQPIVSGEEVLEMQRLVRQVTVHPVVEEYLLALVRATRQHPTIELGASPRASLALYHAGQAYAALAGRSFVIPDDLKYLAPFVLTHRLILNTQTYLRGRTADDIVREVINSVPVPVEEEALG